MNDSPTDTDLITFAGRRYNAAGARERSIRETFGYTATRFWQKVNQILDNPHRIAALPAELWPVVNRLDRERQRQVEQRMARRAS